MDLDIIEPSTSKWSSLPHFPNLQKDSDVRIVVDYCKLNAVTVPELFQWITSLSALVMLNSYQSLICSKDFIRSLLFQSRVPPLYGLFCKHGKHQNAPATFQLLMQHVLHALDSIALPYIDNVVIISKSLFDHMSHIDHVLQDLEMMDIQSNLQNVVEVSNNLSSWVSSSFGYISGKSSSTSKLHTPLYLTVS